MENDYVLTKDLVMRAYEAGIIKIIPLDEACGESEPSEWEPVVEIGEHWFFAFGSEVESTAVSEYLANTPKTSSARCIPHFRTCRKTDSRPR